ncbi:hypothetical protein ACWDBC_20955 [Streptomyces parvus]|nr:hypothetical protein DBP12_27275 [Streptomyces sp. CS014]
MLSAMNRVGDRVLARLVPRTNASADASFWQYCYCTADWRKIYKLCHVVGGRTACGECSSVRYIGC